MTSWTKDLTFCSERQTYPQYWVWDGSSLLWLYRLLLRKPSRVELNSQGRTDNTEPVCPAEDTETVSSSTSLWQEPSAEWGISFMYLTISWSICDVNDWVVDLITPVIITSEPNKFSNVCLALVHQHLNHLNQTPPTQMLFQLYFQVKRNGFRAIFLLN